MAKLVLVMFAFPWEVGAVRGQSRQKYSSHQAPDDGSQTKNAKLMYEVPGLDDSDIEVKQVSGGFVQQQDATQQYQQYAALQVPSGSGQAVEPQVYRVDPQLDTQNQAPEPQSATAQVNPQAYFEQSQVPRDQMPLPAEPAQPVLAPIVGSLAEQQTSSQAEYSLASLSAEDQRSIQERGCCEPHSVTCSVLMWCRPASPPKPPAPKPSPTNLVINLDVNIVKKQPPPPPPQKPCAPMWNVCQPTCMNLLMASCGDVYNCCDTTGIGRVRPDVLASHFGSWPGQTMNPMGMASADTDKDGYVTKSEFKTYVAAAVAMATPVTPVPAAPVHVQTFQCITPPAGCLPSCGQWLVSNCNSIFSCLDQRRETRVQISVVVSQFVSYTSMFPRCADQNLANSMDADRDNAFTYLEFSRFVGVCSH